MLTKTQKECKEKLAAALEQTGKVDAHKTGQFTVGQWAETWFENYAKPAIRETTADYYKNYIDKAHHSEHRKNQAGEAGHAGYIEVLQQRKNQGQKGQSQAL